MCSRLCSKLADSSAGLRRRASQPPAASSVRALSLGARSPLRRGTLPSPGACRAHAWRSSWLRRACSRACRRSPQQGRPRSCGRRTSGWPAAAAGCAPQGRWASAPVDFSSSWGASGPTGSCGRPSPGRLAATLRHSHPPQPTRPDAHKIPPSVRQGRPRCRSAYGRRSLGVCSGGRWCTRGAPRLSAHVPGFSAWTCSRSL